MIKIIVSFITISWIIYTTVFFIIFDDSINTVKKIQYPEIKLLLSLDKNERTSREIDERLERIKILSNKLGINTNDGLYEILEKNPNIHNLNIHKETFKQSNKIDNITLSYDLISGETVKINFLVADKALLRQNPTPKSFIISMSASCQASENTNEFAFNNPKELDYLVASSFMENNQLTKVIQGLCTPANKFNTKSNTLPQKTTTDVPTLPNHNINTYQNNNQYQEEIIQNGELMIKNVYLDYLDNKDISHFYSTDLNHIFLKDGELAEKGEGIACLDYSPIIQGQDFDKQEILNTLKVTSIDNHMVRVNFENLQGNTQIDFQLKCDKNSCLIDDIITPEIGSFKQTTSACLDELSNIN